jgi:hypothetical protein
MVKSEHVEYVQTVYSHRFRSKLNEIRYIFSFIHLHPHIYSLNHHSHGVSFRVSLQTYFSRSEFLINDRKLVRTLKNMHKH